MSRADTAVERASRLDTTAISDAMDRLGIAGQCLGIKPLDRGMRVTGRAFTILYGPSGKPPGTVGDYIDDVPGAVSWCWTMAAAKTPRCGATS